MVHQLTDQTFQATVGEESRPVVVDLWAPWCGPCRVIGPVVESLAAEREDLMWAKLNIDENPQVTNQYGVQSIPTLLVLQNGKEVGRLIGAKRREQLIAEIDQVLAR